MNERVAVTDAKAYIDEMDEREKKKKDGGCKIWQIPRDNAPTYRRDDVCR